MIHVFVNWFEEYYNENAYLTYMDYNRLHLPAESEAPVIRSSTMSEPDEKGFYSDIKWPHGIKWGKANIKLFYIFQ